MSLNAPSVSASAALDVLQAGWAAQCSGTLTASWMLHGRPGVGKTEVAAQLALSIGADLYDIRLTTIEPQDLRGLPYYDHAAGKTVWYRPEDLPDDPARPAILFLDELTAASPYLQPTVYGLLQERRVGRHTLPASVMILAAGNSTEDGAIAYEMGTALSDRLIHMQITANAQDWLTKYAVDQALHPAVTAFLRARPDLLESSEASLRRGDLIACTPRSWVRVSDIMHAVTTASLRRTMISGTIGLAVAAEFLAVADEIAALVSVDELLATNVSKRRQMMPATLNGLVGLIYAIAARADAETCATLIDILADLPNLAHTNAAQLPLGELRAFGFELLIRKALKEDLTEAFRSSASYAAYAKDRENLGLP